MRRQLEQSGTAEPVFAFETGGRIEPCPMDLGPLLNDGDTKDVLFASMRTIVDRHKITAAVFVTDGWFGRSTAKLNALPREEQRRVIKGRNFNEVIEQGWFERCEALVITGQTAEAVWIVHQFYDRDSKRKRVTFTERTEDLGPQARFDGRFKMFGAKPSPDVFHGVKR
jgi:hypothetical protein